MMIYENVILSFRLPKIFIIYRSSGNASTISRQRGISRSHRFFFCRALCLLRETSFGGWWPSRKYPAIRSNGMTRMAPIVPAYDGHLQLEIVAQSIFNLMRSLVVIAICYTIFIMKYSVIYECFNA